MLVIGAAQIRALEEARINQFLHQLAGHLRRSFGAGLSQTDEELLTAARLCYAAAKLFGIEFEDDIRRYAEFAIKYGFRMHEDRRHPWIGQTLALAGLSGTEKMDALDYLELQIARFT